MRVELLRNLGMLYRESTQLKITIMLLLIVLIGKSLTVKLLQLRKKMLLLQECLVLIGLFDQNYLNQAKEKLLKKYPQLVGKKIILYAPL